MESNVQASPKDIAEYVFWTGDEKSVTSAIEDYMRAGLVSFLFREHIPRPKKKDPKHMKLYNTITNWVLI